MVQRILSYTELFQYLIGISLDNRYLGLFGDHIVQAILYRYTQELRRPDLVDAKGKPLIKNACLKAVWSRLANRMATVMADTSMVTISPQYATHFFDMYTNGKENAKLTGDSLRQDEDPHALPAVHGPRPYCTRGILGYPDKYYDLHVISCAIPG